MLIQKRKSDWSSEFSGLLLIGIPIVLTQLVQFSVNTIDIIMIGRLGPEALAASTLGFVLYLSVWLFACGPAMAVSPMVSHAVGAGGDPRDDVRVSVRMGLWAVAMLFPAALALFLITDKVALALGQPEVLAASARNYVLALAFGLPFSLGILVLRNFLAALEKMRVPLLIVIVTTILNALLNYMLIYGNFGMPRLELIGAGVASSLSHLIGFLALAAYVALDREAKSYRIFSGLLKPDWPRLREVFGLGAPIGADVAFEAMLFNAAVFLMGRIGVLEVAAYQVAFNVAQIAYMIAVGLAMAGAVRVGLAAGAGDIDRIRRASALTIGVCTISVLAVAGPALFAPVFVASLYLESDKAANAALFDLVVVFLPIAGAFALFDAVQMGANQCLRGLKDVRIPMVLTGVSYWVIGFPLAAWFGLFTSMGAMGVWLGLFCGVAADAALQSSRLWRLTRRPIAATKQEVFS